MAWKRTGSIDPPALADARLQLHWAAQCAAGVGRTLQAPRPDDSHTSFVWSERMQALMQETVGGRMAGILPRTLTLVVIDHGVRHLPLAGRTLEEGFEFFESIFGKPIRRPDVELPAHPVAGGARFTAEEAHLSELELYFADAALLLENLGAVRGDAGVVRCWPHHFDIATLITLGGGQTVGVGMSPGDVFYPQPYWYVTPHPYPPADSLPSLESGRWHTEGWTGAVFLAGDFSAADDQAGAVRDFVDRALQALA